MRKEFVASTVAVASALALYTGCVLSDKRPESTDGAAHSSTASGERDVAATNRNERDVKEHLVFYTAKVQRNQMGDSRTSNESITLINAERWASFPKKEASRAQAMLEFYFSNTRDDSSKVNFVCFFGKASNVVTDFFQAQPIAENLQDLAYTHSSDELMVGVQFRFKHKGKVRQAHFRIPHCNHAGKSGFFDQATMEKLTAAVNKADRKPNADDGFGGPTPFENTSAQHLAAALKRAPASLDLEGFAVNDQVRGFSKEVTPEDRKGLPTFRMRNDTEVAHRFNEPAPWVQKNFNLKDPKQAYLFALLMKKYAYDGMGNQSPVPSQNLIAQNAKGRYWCHMPWLNQGPTGREAIHGLTQERPLAPSAMYPNPSPGSDWGVAVFNSVACRSIDRMFGSITNPRPPAAMPKTPEEWSKLSDIGDGSVIAKYLFTTANFRDIENAWKIVANVSPPNSNERLGDYVRHIQLDIGIKDSRLRGVPLIADNWIMLTYYYDENYDSAREYGIEADIGENMPIGIQKMRPAGIQWGFGPNDSLIFKGAVANSVGGRMLNGPADNAKSSCLGCHGVAGTQVSMIPGIISTEQWKKEKATGVTLDMGQQFAFAKRNYETRPVPDGKR